MIATLTGRILLKYPDRAVIDVGGVGYEVMLSTDGVSRLPERGGEVFLHIHTNVREDAITLFGFLDEQEKELFLLLRTVSGIGPKLALAILSGMPVESVCQAIVAGDIKRLSTLPGIGKRTAERLCVELKEKVAHLQHGAVPLPQGAREIIAAEGSTAADALSALTNLGYPDAVARVALTKVKTQLGDEAFAGLRLETLIREALRTLA
jgi:Holliday junction DNA helicase RuvA